MPAKDFKAGFKANSLNGRKVMPEGATVPFGYSPLREELERQAEDLAVIEIPIVQLHDNPYQELARPQLNEEALQELATSIRENGFYGALLARRKSNTSDQYELAYGHRRKEAARRAGLVTLPVKVLDLSNEKMARIMASENFSRQDLTPIGEANVIGLLESTQNLSSRQIAEIIGQGRSWVERRLALYHSSQDLKEMVSQKPDTLSHLDLLIPVKDTYQRQNLIDEILAGDLTRKQVQEKLKIAPRPQSPATTATRIGTADNTNFDNSYEEAPSPILSNNNIVKNFTKLSQRGNSEIRNNNPVEEVHQQNWSEAINLIADGVKKMEKLLQQTSELPSEEKKQLNRLSKRITLLLAN
jgi:ParB/RepB/Spo0J family partition protein